MIMAETSAVLKISLWMRAVMGYNNKVVEEGLMKSSL